MGAVSALAHVLGEETCELYSLVKQGKAEEAKKLQQRLVAQNAAVSPHFRFRADCKSSQSQSFFSLIAQMTYRWQVCFTVKFTFLCFCDLLVSTKANICDAKHWLNGAKFGKNSHFMPKWLPDILPLRGVGSGWGGVGEGDM